MDNVGKKIVNILKKITCFILVIAMIASISGCSLKPHLKLVKQDAKKIFELLKNKDADSLSEYFSDDSKKNHNLKEEWKAFFENIDGNIAEYDEISFGSELEEYREGELYEHNISVIFKNVKTDTGIIYERLTYYITYVLKDNPSYEGIDGFVLMTNIDDKDKNGLNKIYVGISE